MEPIVRASFRAGINTRIDDPTDCRFAEFSIPVPGAADPVKFCIFSDKILSSTVGTGQPQVLVFREDDTKKDSKKSFARLLTRRL